MVLAQKQTYKSMEQDRKPGRGGLCQQYTTKQVELQNGGKTVSSKCSAWKTGQLHVEN